MRLEQYLNESDKLDKDSIINAIRRDCKPFLNEFPFPLFRGMDKNHESFFIKTPRTDRLSLAGNDIKHRTADKIFKELFGWKWRSEGVFTTTSYGFAGGYGPVYRIYPVNGYKYIYNPDIVDSINVTITIRKEVNTKVSILSSPYSPEFKSTYIECAKEYLKESYTDKGLKNIKESADVEVTLKCDNYYIIRDESSLVLSIKKKMRGK